MSNYLYNGVELPELPSWNKSLYPVGLIIHCLSPEAITTYGGEYVFAYGTRTAWNGRLYLYGFQEAYVVKNGTWRLQFTSDFIGNTLLDAWYEGWYTPHWTNTDILTPEGTGIFLAASEPVLPGDEPEEPEQPEEPETPTIAPAQLRRAFVCGLITGLQLRGNIRKKPATSAYYLYGTPSESGNVAIAEGDGYTLYTGAVLPKPPADWDEEKYPYALVTYMSTSVNTVYDFRCFAQRPYYSPDNYGVWQVRYEGKYQIAQIKPLEAETVKSWPKLDEYTTGEVPDIYYSSWTTFLWGNFDIINTEDANVFFSASDAIPLASNEPVGYTEGGIPIYKRLE